MYKRSIVITGIGVFCAAGDSVIPFRESLLNGRSGIGPVDLFDVSAFPSHIGAQVRGYDPLNYFDRRTVSRLSRTDQFALIAAEEAWKASGVEGHYSPFDLGVSMGAGAAGMLHGEEWLRLHLQGEPGSPSLLRGVLPDRTSTVVAERFGMAGYQGTVTTACSSSATAIGWGADLIRSGRQKALLCGGSDAFSLLTYAGFNSLRVVDPEPCSPFSLGRQGISLGEGAAFLVLEEENEALRRGVKILGRVLGYGLSGEGYHMTAPEPTGSEAARVMANALADAGLSTSAVGWVNAHGTGTPLNDVVETKGMKLVFGEQAGEVPLVSTKAMTGHCLGAAGAIEAAATLICLAERRIPQTLNFRRRDPECDIDYRHDGGRHCDLPVALSNSFAFGGNITSLVLSR